VCKPNTVAFQIWNLDPEQLLAIPGVPNPNVIYGARSKQLRISMWKRDIIDTLVMTGVAELAVEDVTVNPVYI
jgi:hypothetical protein